MSLPYYRQHGWEPVVLAVRPDDVAGSREPELEQTYPADVRVVRCRALPLRWTRWIGLGNLGLRAWWPLLRAGSRLIKGERFDLVLFSNTQFITFTLGPLWRRWFGIPYVIDLQDPWRTDSYERPGAPPPPGGRKYLLARCLAFLCEGPTYRRTAGFISVSPRYLSDLARRYPWFQNKPQATIRFGVSAADFEYVRFHPPGGARLVRQVGKIHLKATLDQDGTGSPKSRSQRCTVRTSRPKYSAIFFQESRRLFMLTPMSFFESSKRCAMRQ